MNYSSYKSNSSVRKSTLDDVKYSSETLNKFLTPLESGFKLNCESDNTTASMRAGAYTLSDRTSFTPNCYYNHQNVSGGGLPASNSNVVDLESELRGITHLADACDSQALKKKSLFRKKNSIQNYNYCDTQLTATDTRVQKSCLPQHSIILDRFDFPLDRVNIQPNSYIGLNTRLVNKRMIEKEDAENGI